MEESTLPGLFYIGLYTVPIIKLMVNQDLLFSYSG